MYLLYFHRLQVPVSKWGRGGPDLCCLNLVQALLPIEKLSSSSDSGGSTKTKVRCPRRKFCFITKVTVAQQHTHPDKGVKVCDRGHKTRPAETRLELWRRAWVVMIFTAPIFIANRHSGAFFTGIFYEYYRNYYNIMSSDLRQFSWFANYNVKAYVHTSRTRNAPEADVRRTCKLHDRVYNVQV